MSLERRHFASTSTRPVCRSRGASPSLLTGAGVAPPADVDHLLRKSDVFHLDYAFPGADTAGSPQVRKVGEAQVTMQMASRTIVDDVQSLMSQPVPRRTGD